MKITVLNNQSLIDIAIATTGDATNYLRIAMANNIVPTDVLKAGDELTIPNGLEVDNDIVRYYKANGIQPATAVSSDIVKATEKDCEQKLYDCFKV